MFVNFISASLSLTSATWRVSAPSSWEDLPNPLWERGTYAIPSIQYIYYSDYLPHGLNPLVDLYRAASVVIYQPLSKVHLPVAMICSLLEPVLFLLQW